MARGVYLDDVKFVNDLSLSILEGQVSLDESFEAVRGLSVSWPGLVEDFMRNGQIGTTGFLAINDPDFKPTAFRACRPIFSPEQSVTSMRALDVVNEMLCHKKWRLVFLNYLWKKVQPKDSDWLAIFSQHLKAPAAYAVLMNLPSTSSRNKAKVIVSREVAKSLSDEVRAEVCIIARGKPGMKVAQLHRLTGWPCCIKYASVAEREFILGSDLGL